MPLTWSARHSRIGQLYAQLHGGSGEPRITASSLLEGFLHSFGVASATLPDDLDERTAMYRSWLAGRRVLIVLDDAGSLSQVLPVLPGSASCAVIITTRHRLGGPDGAHQFEIEAFDNHAGECLLATVIFTERVRSDEASVRATGPAVRPAAARTADHRGKARGPAALTVGQMVRRLRTNGAAWTSSTWTASASGPRSPSPTRPSASRRRGCWLASACWDRETSRPGSGHHFLKRTRPQPPTSWRNWWLPGWWRRGSRPTDTSATSSMTWSACSQSSGSCTASRPARTAALSLLLSCRLFLACETHRRECGGNFSLLHGDAPLWRLSEDSVDELLSAPARLVPPRAGVRCQRDPPGRPGRAGRAVLDSATTSVTVFEAGTYTDDWRTTHEAALEAVRRAGNRRGEAAVLCSLATLSLTKELGGAGQLLTAAFAIFDELQDIHGRALALGRLAFLDRLAGQEEEALIRYRQALTWFREVGDLISEIVMLSGTAKINLDRGDDDEAEALLSEALQICQRVRSRRVKAQTTYQLGELYLKRNDLARAEEAFDEVLQLTRGSDDVIGQAYALLGAGTVRSQRGDQTGADDKLQSALELAQRTGHSVVQGQIPARRWPR